MPPGPQNSPALPADHPAPREPARLAPHSPPEPARDRAPRVASSGAASRSPSPGPFKSRGPTWFRSLVPPPPRLQVTCHSGDHTTGRREDKWRCEFKAPAPRDAARPGTDQQRAAQSSAEAVAGVRRDWIWDLGAERRRSAPLVHARVPAPGARARSDSWTQELRPRAGGGSQPRDGACQGSQAAIPRQEPDSGRGR